MDDKPVMSVNNLCWRAIEKGLVNPDEEWTKKKP